jgi:acylphosphatase
MVEEPSPEVRVRRLVKIDGLVQGVYFRASCAREAERLGITGTIRNLEDGTVEGDFEGAPESIDALVDWCHTGPPDARVSRVVVSEAEAIGYRAFRTA